MMGSCNGDPRYAHGGNGACQQGLHSLHSMGLTWGLGNQDGVGSIMKYQRPHGLSSRCWFSTVLEARSWRSYSCPGDGPSCSQENAIFFFLLPPFFPQSSFSPCSTHPPFSTGAHRSQGLASNLLCSWEWTLNFGSCFYPPTPKLWNYRCASPDPLYGVLGLNSGPCAYNSFFDHEA